jgi:histone H2B
VHPQLALSKKAMVVMNDLINDLSRKLAAEASGVVKYDRAATLSSRSVQTAVRLVMGRVGGLSKYCVSEGTKAITKLAASRG